MTDERRWLEGLDERTEHARRDEMWAGDIPERKPWELIDTEFREDVAAGRIADLLQRFPTICRDQPQGPNRAVVDEDGWGCGFHLHRLIEGQPA